MKSNYLLLDLSDLVDLLLLDEEVFSSSFPLCLRFFFFLFSDSIAAVSDGVKGGECATKRFLLLRFLSSFVDRFLFGVETWLVAEVGS